MTETSVEPRVWLLECPYLDTMICVYTTEAAARVAAERYVRENAARQPITHLEWRSSPAASDDYRELWGKVDGRMYSAQLVVYSLPVLDTPGSDGDHEAA